MKRKVLLSVSMFLLLGIFGCKEEPQMIDGEMFAKNLESAPFVTVPQEELPDWVNQIIDDYTIAYAERPYFGTIVQIFRGEWNKRTVYYIVQQFECCPFRFYDENYEQIPLIGQEDYNNFYTLSKNWELIFEIANRSFQSDGFAN